MEFAASAVGAKLVTLNSGQGLWQIEHRNGVIMNEDKPEHIAEVAGVLSEMAHVLHYELLQDYKTCRWILAMILSFIAHSSKPVINLESALWHPARNCRYGNVDKSSW